MTEEELPPPKVVDPAISAAAAAMGRKGGKARQDRSRSRANSYRHGGEARTVTPQEGRMARLARIDPELPGIIRAAVAAERGDLAGWNAVGGQALVELEVLRRQSMDAVAADGVVVEDVTESGGVTTTVKKKAHPLIEHTIRMHRVLGFDAEQMELSKKSRGQGDKDAAVTALLLRRASLRARSRELPAPEPDIETTAVVK